MEHSATGRRPVAHIGTRVLAFGRTCDVQYASVQKQLNRKLVYAGSAEVLDARIGVVSADLVERALLWAALTGQVQASRTRVQHSERKRAYNARAMEQYRAILQCLSLSTLKECSLSTFVNFQYSRILHG